MHVVEAPLHAADDVGEAEGEFVRARRHDVAVDLRAQARNVRRRPRRAVVAAVGEEPVPQNRQRPVRGEIRTRAGVDVRTLIIPAETRLTAASRSRVDERGADASDVAREADIRQPLAVALEIPGDAEAWAPL